MEERVKALLNEYNDMLNSQGYISKKKYDDYIYKYNDTFSNIDKSSSFYSKVKEIENNGYSLIDKHNQEYLDNQYIKYKDYFENMYKGIDDNIKLDEEQIKAILADEDYALIIAGAGTGKTTTMTSKVKYLVDIKKVDPSKILVMSYTKKATMELEERIVGKFNIPACVMTFHSLGYKYIKQIFKGRKCVVIDANEKQSIFLDYFKFIFTDKEKIKKLIDLFRPTKSKIWYFSDYFSSNYEKYDTYEEFFEEYKKHKLEEAKEEKYDLKKIIDKRIEKYKNGYDIKTIRNEIVRSEAECIIANFLFTHGIQYAYEKVYAELMDDNSTYKPDFTLNLNGEEVYLEYFGLDNYKYNLQRKKKEEYHRTHDNKFISLDRVPLNELEEVLDSELKKMGFIYKIKSDEEIYEQILENNPTSQMYPYMDFLYSCIEHIKQSIKRDDYRRVVYDYLNGINDLERRKTREEEFKCVDEFYKYYQKRLYGEQIYKFDYADLLYYSNKYIHNIDRNKLNFEYIIIDEYQDISKEKYEIARKTADRSGAKVFAVGDDWQSIYAFSGAKIEYIYNFDKYFHSSKMFRITKTYRNSQELIDSSGEFIMRNKSQIPKELISNKSIDDPIKFIEFGISEEEKERIEHGEISIGYFEPIDEYDCLKQLILQIHKENPNHNILVLARTNAMIDRCFDDGTFKDALETKITFVGYEDIELEGMTMHKSKGLTFDEVILIGLDNIFPREVYELSWVIELFKNPSVNEALPYAEERRLFYVALTRTKNNVYLLFNRDARHRSPFVDEIKSIVDNNKKTDDIDTKSEDILYID